VVVMLRYGPIKSLSAKGVAGVSSLLLLYATRQVLFGFFFFCAQSK
jgi:hypothetical protein